MAKNIQCPYKAWAMITGISSIVLLLIVIWLLYRAGNTNIYIEETETIIIEEDEIY